MRVSLQVVQGRGGPQTVQVEAESVAQARQDAAARGFEVLEASAAFAWPWTARRPAARMDVPLFVEQLHDLLNAGLSAGEALGVLAQGRRSDATPVLAELIRRLEEGAQLSEALAAAGTFPPLLVALVRASEQTSDLPRALSSYLLHDKRSQEVRHRLRAAAIYPMLLMIVGAAVLVFLAVYVMPRFARIFEGMNTELPWSARLMVGWARWLGTDSTGHLVLVAGGAVGLVLLAALPVTRQLALTSTLKIPWLNHLVRDYHLARWYRATGLLMKGGIPLPEALAFSRKLLAPWDGDSGRALERAIDDGHSPADAYVHAAMATPVAAQLLKAGERTGELGDVLERIASFHEADVTRRVERAMRAMEPAVMALVGLAVGFIVVLMYLPIFDLASAIQ